MAAACPGEVGHRQGPGAAYNDPAEVAVVARLALVAAIVCGWAGGAAAQEAGGPPAAIDPAPARAGAGTLGEVTRWRQLFLRLVSGARRLLLRSGAPGGDPAGAEAKSRELGATLQEALTALERDAAGNPGLEPALATGRRCLADWRAIDRELGERREAVARTGPGTQAGPGVPGALLAAERFVGTYGRALQRIVQLLRRGLLKPLKSPIKKKDLPQVRDRVIGGYRQAEVRVQQARNAARSAAPRAGAGPDPTARAERRLQQLWRRVQRDFRIARKLAQQLQARFDFNQGPPCPGGDCPEPEL